MRSGWTYNYECDTYLWGEQENGCGVFYEDGKWNANVVAFGNLLLLGEYLDVEVAQLAAEQEFKHQREINGYE